MQWAASSPQAGLGYLVRQAIRAGWALQTRNLSAALSGLRPYRNGAIGKPIDALLNRIRRDIGLQEVNSRIWKKQMVALALMLTTMALRS